MANRYEEDSCSLMWIDTEQLEEDDQFRDVIMESDHYLLEFQKTNRHVIVYDCSHGWRFHNILRKIPEIKRYRIHYSRLNSSFECVSSLLQDQGLVLDDICIQRIATFMVEHRTKYCPGSPVKVVAGLSLRRREQVNRCVNYGHMDLDELEDEIGMEDFTVSVGWHFDLLDHDQETLEEEMCDSSNFTPLEEIGDWLWGEDEEDDAALVPFVAGSNSLPCYTFIGSGEETCSICLNEFSQGDKFFSAECFHNFHQMCIQGWMMKKSNCPICRKHIQIPISRYECLQVDPLYMREVLEILDEARKLAANCDVESFWPNLFSKLMEKKNVNVGSGGGGGEVVAVSAAAAPAEATPATEEKNEEIKEDSDVENIFGLFDEKKNQQTILHLI